MFIVHNVTSQRVAMKLQPSKAAAEGTPNWQARRFARQNTFHVVVDPHRTVDLMSFGYTEKELLAQPEVLEYLRLGYLRRVKSEGGGYMTNQFKPQLPVHPSLTVDLEEPVPATQRAEELLADSQADVAPSAPVEAVQEAIPTEEPALVVSTPAPPASPPPKDATTRTPFRPKKRR